MKCDVVPAGVVVAGALATAGITTASWLMWYSSEMTPYTSLHPHCWMLRRRVVARGWDAESVSSTWSREALFGTQPCCAISWWWIYFEIIPNHPCLSSCYLQLNFEDSTFFSTSRSCRRLVALEMTWSWQTENCVQFQIILIKHEEGATSKKFGGSCPLSIKSTIRHLDSYILNLTSYYITLHHIIIILYLPCDMHVIKANHGNRVSRHSLHRNLLTISIAEGCHYTFKGRWQGARLAWRQDWHLIGKHPRLKYSEKIMSGRIHQLVQ